MDWIVVWVLYWGPNQATEFESEIACVVAKYAKLQEGYSVQGCEMTRRKAHQ